MQRHRTAKNHRLTLETVVERLKQDQPEKIILFGSYATGQTDEYSDLDLVVIRKTDKRFLERLVETSRTIGFDLGKIDVFVYSPEEWQRMIDWENPFAEQVLKEGKVVYEKE
ncbi:MAG: nucleotidyltransferase domain-containing protein [Chloroflexota bacterium]